MKRYENRTIHKNKQVSLHLSVTAQLLSIFVKDIKQMNKL